MSPALLLDSLGRHVRYGIRALARTPGTTITLVATLAVGIGASSAIFTALNAVLLRPLPFPEGDRLMRVEQTQERTTESHIAPARLEDWARQSTAFASITGYYAEDASETSGDLPERVRRAFVAPRFFDVWGVPPAAGRAFIADEHRNGGPPAVIVSHRYWTRRFGGQASLDGAVVRIGQNTVPVVGVMPDSFLFPDRGVDLWFPVALTPPMQTMRTATWYEAVGRLRSGVTVAQARADLTGVQAALGRQYPDTDRTIGGVVTPLRDAAVGDLGASLWLLFGAVSVLLLITCTNVAAVLLSRATQRRQEAAVRLSLGATRASLVVQGLVETLLLALTGGTAGLAIAAGASAALRALEVDLPRMDEVAIDRRVLFYTFAIATLAALVCGLLPALRAARAGSMLARGAGGRTHTASRHTLQWLLVGVQVALSVTLLAGAGLLVRSFHQLWRLDAGFDASRVLTFRVSGHWGETVQYDRLLQRVDRLLDEMRALPGVESAATAIFAPGVPAAFESAFAIVERRRPGADRLPAQNRVVSPGYFATMRIPLVDGAVCGNAQIKGPREALVNRAFARQFLGDVPSPIGLHVTTGDAASPAARIVGVVGDARERGLDREPGPTVYTCFSAPTPTPVVLLRTHGDPAALTQAVRLRVKALEPTRAVYDIAPLDARLGQAYTQNHVRVWLVTTFAVTALLLSCLGLYGTLSYAISLRRREIGVRFALGALRRDIVGQFVRQGLIVAGAASVAGLALAWSLTGVVSTMLTGVSPTDPLTLGAVVLVVMTVAGLAALVPSTRAARLEPVRALREE